MFLYGFKIENVFIGFELKIDKNKSICVYILYIVLNFRFVIILCNVEKRFF